MAPIILHARQGHLSKPVDMNNFRFLGNARQRSEDLLSPEEELVKLRLHHRRLLMLDLKLIRENPELIREALRKRQM